LAGWFWRRFFKIFCVFYPLPLKILESSPSKDDLCQVWLKLVQGFWKKRFLNDPIQFLHFCDYLPFEEDLALYLKKT
jgi:hypothetical protein